MKRKITIEIICFLLIVLFFYTAASKLIDYRGFVGQIGKSPLLTNYAESIAWVVPCVEVFVTVLLAIPRFRLVGLYAGFGLMTLFTLYIIAILSFSKELPCSCGGILNTLGWKSHLIFNVFFLVLAVGGVKLQTEEQKAKIIAAGK